MIIKIFIKTTQHCVITYKYFINFEYFKEVDLIDIYLLEFNYTFLNYLEQFTPTFYFEI